MRIRNRLLPLLLLSLALALPVRAAGETAAGEQVQEQEKDQSAPRNESDPYRERFEQLDRDKDGYVSRSEWPLEPKSFDVVDRDKDGRLSRFELLTPNVQDERLRRGFHQLDLDRDGRLSRLEWQRSGRSLGPLDGDGDGYISLTELRRAQVGSDQPILLYPQDRRLLHNLDRNGDNRLSRLEWTGSRSVFLRLDRNRDGFVSPSELRR